MSQVSLGYTPHILFEPTNNPAWSDWFVVVFQKGDLPAVVNGNQYVFPLGSAVYSTGVNGVYDANELYFEYQSLDNLPVRFGPNFTADALKMVGFMRVCKGHSSVPVGAAINAYGSTSVVND